MISRILVVDDNVSLTTLLSKALGKFDYEVVVENDSNFALDTARRVRPNLILLDVMMPDRDGGEVLQELRFDPQLRPIPVILLTALAREAQGLANQGGIESVVLSKPIEIQVLLQEIRKHLVNSMEQSESLSDQMPSPASPFGNLSPQAPIAPDTPPVEHQNFGPRASGSAFGGPDPSLMRASGQGNPFGGVGAQGAQAFPPLMPDRLNPENPFARGASRAAQPQQPQQQETISQNELDRIKAAKEVTLPR